jgi:hypothetical protein
MRRPNTTTTTTPPPNNNNINNNSVPSLQTSLSGRETNCKKTNQQTDILKKMINKQRIVLASPVLQLDQLPPPSPVVKNNQIETNRKSNTFYFIFLIE